MRAKFQRRDKVRFKTRVPLDILAALRHRTRTVVEAWYSRDDQCRYYELGSRGKGVVGYLFRSYMLIHAQENAKRRYGNKRTRYTFPLASLNQNLGTGGDGT